jgi:hypothetical protein
MHDNSSRIPDLFVEQNPPCFRLKICDFDCPLSRIRPEQISGLNIDGNAFWKIDVFVEKNFHFFSVEIQTSNAATCCVRHVKLQKKLTFY